MQSMPSSPACSAEPDELQADKCPYQPIWTAGTPEAHWSPTNKSMKGNQVQGWGQSTGSCSGALALATTTPGFRQSAFLYSTTPSPFQVLLFSLKLVDMAQVGHQSMKTKPLKDNSQDSDKAFKPVNSAVPYPRSTSIVPSFEFLY